MNNSCPLNIKYSFFQYWKKLLEVLQMLIWDNFPLNTPLIRKLSSHAALKIVFEYSEKIKQDSSTTQSTAYLVPRVSWIVIVLIVSKTSASEERKS